MWNEHPGSVTGMEGLEVKDAGTLTVKASSQGPSLRTLASVHVLCVNSSGSCVQLSCHATECSPYARGSREYVLGGQDQTEGPDVILCPASRVDSTPGHLVNDRPVHFAPHDVSGQGTGGKMGFFISTEYQPQHTGIL